MRNLVKCTALLVFLLTSSLINGQVYSKTGKFSYTIAYFQKENNLSTQEIIELNLTGKKWKWDNSQLEGLWTYLTQPGTKHKFKKQKTLGWCNVDTTGIIENQYRVWMHPPRHNQYCLTELSPFPDFRKNTIVGDTYATSLSIDLGWDNWDGKKIISTYTIKDCNHQSIDTVWTIEAISQFGEFTNTAKFIFNERMGFTSIEYNFYNGDTLTMNLNH
jgi:hypothetical protein